MKARSSYILIIAVILLSCKLCCSTEYYVATNGDDSRSTAMAQSISTPWLTVQKCATNAIAGDTCFVLSGTYDEEVTLPSSGTDNDHRIKFVSYTYQGAIIRGFYAAARSYIDIVGFTVTHTGGSNTMTIMFAGGGHNRILHNYIHHTDSDCDSAIKIGYYSSASSNNEVRGNTIHYSGCAANDDGNCVGMGGIHVNGDANLIEYNSIDAVSDYITTTSSGATPDNNIIRNNYFGLTSLALFPNYSAIHADGYQPQVAGQTGTVFERNYLKDNIVTGDAHLFFTRQALEMTIIRENASIRDGEFNIGYSAADRLYMYHNTFVDGQYGSTGTYTVTIDNESTNYSLGNVSINNVFYKSNVESSGKIYSITAGNELTKDYDCHYLSGDPTEDHDTNSDPLFVSYATDDIHLASGSPCISAGRYLTLSSGSGNGTSLTVDDAKYFVGQDHGVYDAVGTLIGDSIIIRSGGVDLAPVTITAVDRTNNILTLAASRTWDDNAEIRLAHQTAVPTSGAWIYKSSYALTATYILSDGTVTVSPSDSSLVRYVEVIEDGMPKGIISSAPYTVTGVGSGELIVKIYTLYASDTPVVQATSTRKFTGNLCIGCGGLFN